MDWPDWWRERSATADDAEGPCDLGRAILPYDLKAIPGLTNGLRLPAAQRRALAIGRASPRRKRPPQMAGRRSIEAR